MKKLTANKVAQHLDIAVKTLDSWYKFYNDPEIEKPEDMPELPAYQQETERGTRYWKEEDLPKLEKFQAWIPKGRGGVMGAVNSKYWSKKGAN